MSRRKSITVGDWAKASHDDVAHALYGYSLFQIVRMDVCREELRRLVPGTHTGQVHVSAASVRTQIIAIVDSSAQAVGVSIDYYGREVKLSGMFSGQSLSFE